MARVLMAVFLMALLGGSAHPQAPSPTPNCDLNGDGLVDFPRDPGCRNPSWGENSQCQDGVNNDGALGTDFDGGESVLGVGNGDPDGPDPDCVDKPWRNSELPPSSGCGIGVELSFLALALFLVNRRRSR